MYTKNAAYCTVFHISCPFARAQLEIFEILGNYLDCAEADKGNVQAKLFMCRGNRRKNRQQFTAIGYIRTHLHILKL